MSYVIASISNAGGAPEQAYRKLQSAGACPERPFAEMFKLEVPSLSVGTLDLLVNLSDDLGKTDQIMEGVVRKIEKCAHELSAAAHSSSSGHHVDLSVGGVPAPRYIQQFAWDSAKFPSRRPLKELVALIAGGSSAIEEELKQLLNSYSDKTTALQELKRRKQGNLLATDLNEVLNEEIMQKVKITDTEHLKTVFIAIPKAMKEVFESTIESVGADIAGYGGPDWTQDSTKLGEPVHFGTNVDRHKTRGSPVVPGSVQLVHTDDDSMLYTVTILAGQYEAGYFENEEFQPGTKTDFMEEFARACREKRFVVRDFVWDPEESNKASMQNEQLQVEVDGMKSALLRWCKNHFGDAFVAWMHLKVVRVFVESVLRYGLPVDFTAVLYKVKKESDLISALDKHLGSGKEADNVDMEDEEEYHEFVLFKFDP